MDARRFKGYLVNGFRFRIKKVDLHRRSQDSGVMLSTNITSFASHKDKNPVMSDMNFYGELTDIPSLRYSNLLRYTLFRCNWMDGRSSQRSIEVYSGEFKTCHVQRKSS